MYADDVPTDVSPAIIQINPTTASVGDEITISGYGFSIIVANNVIIVGDQAITSTSYSLVENPTQGEIESITFLVPDGLSAGEYEVLVIVNEVPSNADIILTVN